MKHACIPIRAAGLVLLVLGLAACSDNGPSTGQLTLKVTDAPVDEATAVVVAFTGVELQPADAAARQYDFDAPRAIDLLALSGGDSASLLEGVSLPSGRYNWVRLRVDATEDGVADSYIALEDGSQHELEIPSGAQTGLKLVSGFVVPAGGHASFTIDFDLRKSVHEPMDAGGSYKLRPALRIVDNSRVGAIGGAVEAALMPEGCAPAVYVYAGSGVTPDDVDGLAPEPVTSARVELNEGSGAYEYRASFLSEGEYTAAFTCDAGSDDPASDDALVFGEAQTATVVAGQTTIVNFSAPAP